MEKIRIIERASVWTVPEANNLFLLLEPLTVKSVVASRRAVNYAVRGVKMKPAA